MTDATHLLFAANASFLGDVRTHAGALGHVTLTAQGEQAIGGRVHAWHAQGITVGDTTVQATDASFDHAFQAWCATERLTVVSLPAPAHIACWHLLAHLPVADADRLGMIQTIVASSADTLIMWQQYLHEANALVATHGQKATAAIQKLKKQYASL